LLLPCFAVMSNVDLVMVSVDHDDTDDDYTGRR
jgi:hypothetical protein